VLFNHCKTHPFQPPSAPPLSTHYLLPGILCFQRLCERQGETCHAAMRLAALSVCRRLVPAAPSLRPRPPPPYCALRQLASSRQDGRREERNPRRGRFVAAGLLTWLGLAKREGDDEPESELVLTIKRGILAARVSAALFLSHPLPLTAHYWWWIRLQLCLSDQKNV